MIFAIALLLFYIYILSRDKYSGVLLTLITSPALMCINLFGNISLHFVLSLILFLLNYRDIIKLVRTKYAFRIVMYIYVGAQILSVAAAVERHAFIPITSLVEEFIPILCLIIAIQKRDNSKNIINILFRFVLLVFILTIFEAVTRSNPYTSFCFNHGLFTSGNEQEMIRYGLKRCNGVFAYIETLGGYSVMTAALSVGLLLSKRLDAHYEKLVTMTFVMSSIMCFLAGSRSGIVSLLFASLPMLFVSKKTRYGMILVILLSLNYMGDYFSSIYAAITDSSSVDGSSIEMREGQFDVAFFYLNMGHQWLGYGPGFTNSSVIGVDSGIVGAESIWLRIIIDQGLIGVLSTIIVIASSIFRLYRINKLYIFLPVSYLLARTVAVVPNMTSTYLLIFTLLLLSFHKEDSTTRYSSNFL